MWVWPKVYQSTTSVSSIGRSCSVQRGRPSPPLALVRVVAGPVALVGAVGRDPDVVVDEPRPLPPPGVRRGERDGVVARAGACSRPARRRGSGTPGLTTFQVRAVSRLRFPRASFSVFSGVATGPEGVLERVVLVDRVGHDVDPLDGVGDAVEVEVEPHVEEVLMIRGVELRGDEVAVRRRLARAGGPQREDAGQLDLELDRAVLVEVPEEAVLVVLDRRDRRDDQPPRPPDLGRVGQAAVGVLPEDAVVFLVHADGVLDRQRARPGCRRGGRRSSGSGRGSRSPAPGCWRTSPCRTRRRRRRSSAAGSARGRRRGRPSR